MQNKIAIGLLSCLLGCTQGQNSPTPTPVVPEHPLAFPGGGLPVPGVVGGVLNYSDAGQANWLASDAAGLVLQSPGTNGNVFWGKPTSQNSAGTCIAGGGRPPATGSGNTYQCTDAPLRYFDDPSTSAWKQFTSEYVPAPIGLTFTLIGTLSGYAYGDALKLVAYGVNGGTSGTLGNCALTPGTLTGSSAWAVQVVGTTLQQIASGGSSGAGMGVCLMTGTTSGTSTGVVNYVFGANSGASNIGWETDTLTLGTTTRTVIRSLQNAAGTQIAVGTGLLHMRLLNDGSQLHSQFSNDGFWWQDYVSTTSISGLTQYGVFCSEDASPSVTDPFGECFADEVLLSTPQQYTISAVTTASPSVFTIGSNTLQVGDYVSISGAAGVSINSCASHGTINDSLGCATVITAQSATTITTRVNVTAGTYTPNSGVVTLLSR